jgi:hypothetical protein
MAASVHRECNILSAAHTPIQRKLEKPKQEKQDFHKISACKRMHFCTHAKDWKHALYLIGSQESKDTCCELNLFLGLHVGIARHKQAQAASMTSASGTHQRGFSVLRLGNASKRYICHNHGQLNAAAAARRLPQKKNKIIKGACKR